MKDYLSNLRISKKFQFQALKHDVKYNLLIINRLFSDEEV